jgi:hypothetical protein
MKHFKIVISYEKYNFMNGKKLAKIFANLIFGISDEVQSSIKFKQLYNEEIFEFLLQNWENGYYCSTLKVSSKSEQGN